jgi:O-antigen/teichoic acid export membrane protein
MESTYTTFSKTSFLAQDYSWASFAKGEKNNSDIKHFRKEGCCWQKIARIYFYTMIQKLLTKLDENKTWNAKVFSSGSFFVFSMMVASALNFLFNAYLGRMLSFADFGVLTFLNTLAYIIGIFTSGLSVTITNETAYLSSKNNEDEATLFFNSMLRKSYIINLIVSIVWIISIPFISLFFNIHDTTPFLLFTPVVTLGIFSAAGWGYLQGMFRFTSLGFITIAEAVGKFIIALILIKLGLQRYAYLPITLSVIFSFVLTLFVVFEKLNFSNVTVQRSNFRFSKRFFFANCIAGLSTTLFLTVDVILAKHYLSAETAGIYSFLSLVGKMIFFFGSMLGAFMFSFIGRDQALKQDTQKTFYRLLAGSAFMASTIYAAVGILGYITLPILFGSKAVTIIPYVTIYGLAMTLFTVSNTYLNYHLAKRNYFFAILSFATTLLLIAEIIINHSSVEVFTNTILTISVIRLLLMIIAHHNCERLRFIWSNLRDFIEAFFFKPKYATQQTHYKKILVFNWRDTNHVFAGGAEVYMHELAKRWIRAGHKVTLFCGNDGNNPRYEIIDGVEVIRRGGFYFVYIWAFLYYMLKFKGKYDVVIDCENG